MIYNMLFSTKFTAHLPPQPGCSADACKTHPRAPPCAVSRFSLPADWPGSTVPVSLLLFLPQIPFLAYPSLSATSKGWPQIACCCFQRQDRCLLLPPDDCKCHAEESGAHCLQQNRDWGHTAQDFADWADVKAGLIAAACRVIQHWNSVALHHRVWRDIDRLKGAEK